MRFDPFIGALYLVVLITLIISIGLDFRAIRR